MKTLPKKYIAKFLLIVLIIGLGAFIFPQKAAAVQNYFLNGTTNTADNCSGTSNTVRDLAGTSDGSDQSINQMNATTYEWNVTETARTISAGTWTVQFYISHDNDGGNRLITVVLARYNNSCVHQEDLVNGTLTPAKGVANQQMTLSNTPGAITFSADDILVLTITANTANMHTLQYGNSTGNFDSRVTFPDEAASTTLTQNDFEFWFDNDATNPTEVWGNPDIAENGTLDAIPATNQAPTSTAEIRLRMNITVSGGTVSADDHTLKLQFATSTVASLDCTTQTGFQDVEANTSTSAWRFAASSVTDGTTITGSISTTDVNGKYSKSNTNTNPATSADPQDYEMDWHIQHNASDATTYCFRMVTTTADLDGYNSDSYPRITTAPGANNLLRHGNFFGDGEEKGFFWTN